METNFNQLDEDREYLERREKRRQRMLAEKRKKKRRRQMIGMICGVLVLGIGIFAGIRMLGGKTNSEDKPEMPVIEAEVTPQVTPAKSQETSAQTENQEPVVETNTSEVETEEFLKSEEKAYSFKETEETGAIYSEEVNSPYGILVNAKNDTIVATKGGKERISPASMTKVLTVLVAAEHLKEKDLEDTFTMTLEITDYSYVNDCSNVGFLDGEQVKVRDLFYGTILQSGGDAAVGLATYVAGSHEAFVEMMNDKLKELGISGTAHFTNCVGLYDEDHYCTLYDLAVIMKAAMDNELCRTIMNAREYTTGATPEHPEGIIISNWFLRRIEDKDTGGEVLGAKTGFVAESGSCAVSYSMQESGIPYICVTAGAYSSWRCIYDHVEILKQYAK